VAKTTLDKRDSIMKYWWVYICLFWPCVTW